MPRSKCAALGTVGAAENEPIEGSSQLIEAVSYGTGGFPAAFYVDDLTHEEVAWHWHSEFEVLAVTEGAVDVLACGQRMTLQQGDAAFVNSGVLHAVKNHVPGQKAALHAIVFHPDIVAGSSDSIYQRRYVEPVMQNSRLRVAVLRAEDEDQRETLLHLTRALDAMLREKPGYEIILRNELSFLLMALRDQGGEELSRADSSGMQRERRAQAMLGFIHSHYASPITLESIAQTVAVSPNEAMRCFGQVVGMSPVRYLKEYRLAQAAKLLKEQKNSVT